MVWHAIRQAALVDWELQGDKILSFRLLRVCVEHIWGLRCCFTQSGVQCKAHAVNKQQTLKTAFQTLWDSLLLVGSSRERNSKWTRLTRLSLFWSVYYTLYSDFLNVNRLIIIVRLATTTNKDILKKYFKKSSSVFFCVIIHFLTPFLPAALRV